MAEREHLDVADHRPQQPRLIMVLLHLAAQFLDDRKEDPILKWPVTGFLLHVVFIFVVAVPRIHGIFRLVGRPYTSAARG